MGNNAKASIIGPHSCSNNTYKRKSHTTATQDLELPDMNGNVEYLRLAKDATNSS